MTRGHHPVAHTLPANGVHPEGLPAGVSEDLPAEVPVAAIGEQMQDEVLHLKSRVGNVEHHLTNMQGQLDSIQEMLKLMILKSSSGTHEEEITIPKGLAGMDSGIRVTQSDEKPSEGTLQGEGKPQSPPNPSHGHVYTALPLHASDSLPSPNATKPSSAYVHPNARMIDGKGQSPGNNDRWNFKQPDNTFSLSISKPKLDFPTFSGENPAGWTRQCEKYFELAFVPGELWVSMATLHCYGQAEHWWAGLRMSAKHMRWTQFVSLVCNRFSEHSMYDVVEIFHSVSQVNTVSNYINKFEELMGHMQRQHPGLLEDYYVRCFVRGLKEQIKHLLKPHRPTTLGEAYSIARELEKFVLHSKPATGHTKFSAIQHSAPQISSQPQASQKLDVVPKPDKLPNISLKTKEPGTCWKCSEPWTPKHRQKCKFYQAAAHSLSVNPEEIHCDQCEESDPDSETKDEPTHEPPTLFQISKQAATGTRTIATFLVLHVKGRRAIALVDSGSTHSFMDATFASKASCEITELPLQTVLIAGGGELFSGGMVKNCPYKVGKESFSNQFQLLELQTYDVILGCDWIFQHSPIGLDLKARILTITKDGTDLVHFSDYTQLTDKCQVSALKLKRIL